jgi:hypothetical protein
MVTFWEAVRLALLLKTIEYTSASEASSTKAAARDAGFFLVIKATSPALVGDMN